MLEENLPLKKKSNSLINSEGLDLCCGCFAEQIKTRQSPILTGYFSEVLRSFTQSRGEYYNF